MPLTTDKRRFYGTPVERFWANVDRAESGCWWWKGTTKPDGYGRIWDGTRQAYAHRFAYEILVGPIPDGLQLDHLCRNTSCVNPEHLEPVTQSENLRRGVFPNSLKTHCPRGHEYTPENVYVPPSRHVRHCRTCQRIQWRIQDAKRRDRRRTLQGDQ